NLSRPWRVDKPAEHLDQFVHLGDMRRAEQLGGTLQWQSEAGVNLAAAGQLRVRSFQLGLPGVMPWQEEDLVVSLQASGVSRTAYTMSTGKLSVRSGVDELDVVLDHAASGA